MNYKREQEKIIEELLQNGKIKAGESIDYEYLNKLYQPYVKQMSEIEFASLLGINYGCYYGIKSRGNKTKVLKDKKKEITEEEKQKIVEELLQSGKIQAGESIDYAYLSKLYQPYAKQMTEIEFASLLGIRNSRYMALKNQGGRAKALNDKKITEEKKQKIAEELLQKEKVQAGEPINYAYFKELYQPYAKQMLEQEFASLLGISSANYTSIKNKGNRTKVLKDKKKEITEEEKQNIVDELLQNEKIQVGQPINYVYFKELYQPYAKQMLEQEFASLLEINYNNYMSMRCRKNRTRVLKGKKLTEEEKQKIIEELLQSEKVQPGEPINYEYFKELYQPYAKQMSEAEFTSLLGISYSNYMNIKKQGQRAKILKDKKKGITEEEKQSIVEKLLQSEKVQPGEPIDYAYFRELYQPYAKQMSELEFASLLGMNYSNYKYIKNKGRRTKILKDKEKEIIEKEKQNIVDELLQNRKIQAGELIDYTHFKELYKPYAKQMPEAEFASLLGINYANYMSIKNKGNRTKVLKDKKKEIPKEEKQKIVEELLQSGKIQVGQPVSYVYFKKLYQPYAKQMLELEFASLLGINYGNYTTIKNKGTKTKILKNKKKEMTEEEEQKIVEELLQSGKIQVDQPISYAYLRKLYQPYAKQMLELEFASLLGISYSRYMNIKSKGDKAKILKDKKKEVTEEEKQNILEELLQSRKIQVGQPVSYVYFKELYQPYEKQMSELEFASLLKISYSRYMSIKNQGERAKVLFDEIKKAIYILKKENRYYSKLELENLSQMYEVSIDDIIQYALCNGNSSYIEDYQGVLKRKGKLWIGKAKCSKEFANKYSELILNSARKISTIICYKYRCEKDISDMASEAIEYILLKGGQIEKNFDNESNIIKIMEAWIATNVKYQCLKEINKVKEISYDAKFTTSKGEYDSLRRRLRDNKTNTEEEAIRKIEKEIIEKKCAKLVMRGIQEGLDKKQAIIEASIILGMKPEEALTIMKKMQDKRKKANDEIEK